MFKKCFSCLLPSSCFQRPSNSLSLPPGFYTGYILELKAHSIRVSLSDPHIPNSSFSYEVPWEQTDQLKGGELVFVLRSEGREVVTVPEMLEGGEIFCDIMSLRSDYTVLRDPVKSKIYVFPLRYVHPPASSFPPQSATVLRLFSPPHFQILLAPPSPPSQVHTSPQFHSSQLLSSLPLRDSKTPNLRTLPRSGDQRDELNYRSFVTADEGDGIVISNLALPECDTPKAESTPLNNLVGISFSQKANESRSGIQKEKLTIQEMTMIGLKDEEIALIRAEAGAWRYCGKGKNSMYIGALIWWMESVAKNSEKELGHCLTILSEVGCEDIEDAVETVQTVLCEVGDCCRENGSGVAIQHLDCALRDSEVASAISICAPYVFSASPNHSDTRIETNQSGTSATEEKSVKKTDIDLVLIMKTLEARLRVICIEEGQLKELRFETKGVQPERELRLFHLPPTYYLLYEFF